MSKQKQNGKDMAMLEQMIQSGSQLILMHDDGKDQPIDEVARQSDSLKLGTAMRVIEMDKTGLDGVDIDFDADPDADPVVDDPYDGEFHYKSWWNQFRGPWLQSEMMTGEEIKTRADDAWECGDYKEVINLMAELICRLEKK